jgi:hypothetical protein
MNPQTGTTISTQTQGTIYSHPTYPKYPEILKQSNIRFALSSLERQRLAAGVGK